MVLRPDTLSLLIIAVLSTGGCTRFGFDPRSSQEAGLSPVDGLVGIDTAGFDSAGFDSAGFDSNELKTDGPTKKVQNDTCDNPTEVSLSQIAVQPVHIIVDTRNAENNYHIGDCATLPEVVFKLVDVPLGTTITWECEGQGKLTTLVSQTQDCPGSGHSIIGNTCLSGTLIGIPLSNDPSYILACWDPSKGTGTLILSLKQ